MNPSPSRLRQEYTARINRVFDYVEKHLAERLDPEELADVACFSRFHFHRIFSAMTGETLTDFIKRVRLEKAASRLINNDSDQITDIAMECGFSSPSVFARAFKERFGTSATEWRDGGWREKSNGSQAQSTFRKADGKDGKAPEDGSAYTDLHTIDDRRRTRMDKLKYTVEVKELPELTVAYARSVGPYSGIKSAFDKLMRWAGPRGLLRFPETKMLAMYHDNPEVTAQDKLRSSACITIPAGTATSGEIGTMTVPGGKFAVGHFEIRDDQFGEAWNALLGDWFPDSGYQPDDRMCYELYLNDHEQHPEKKFLVDICEPVKPL